MAFFWAEEPSALSVPVAQSEAAVVAPPPAAALAAAVLAGPAADPAGPAPQPTGGRRPRPDAHRRGGDDRDEQSLAPPEPGPCQPALQTVQAENRRRDQRQSRKVEPGAGPYGDLTTGTREAFWNSADDDVR